MKTTLSMISCLTLTVGCATTDDVAGLQRQAVHAQGANFGHLSFDVAANTLRWTEAGAYRQLNLATNQLVVARGASPSSMIVGLKAITHIVMLLVQPRIAPMLAWQPYWTRATTR